MKEKFIEKFKIWSRYNQQEIIRIKQGKYKVKDGNDTDITRYLQFNNFNLPIDSITKPSYINRYLIKYLKQ